MGDVEESPSFVLNFWSVKSKIFDESESWSQEMTWGSLALEERHSNVPIPKIKHIHKCNLNVKFPF